MWRLFRKKRVASSEVLTKLRELAHTSTQDLGTHAMMDKYNVVAYDIELSNKEKMMKLATSTLLEFDQLVANYDAWASRINDRNKEIADRGEYTIEDTAFLIAMSLAQTEYICECAVETYPDDKDVDEIAAQLMSTNLAGLAHMFGEDKKEFGKPNEAAALMLQLPYVNQHIERRILS